ncbi:hypothetical protein [Clostridium sp.]|jgi:hypothetical protein|uniref:hypothetical protein n=1 Tax=Clostridium sp. TaxID=1506 RepID=UPI003A47E61C
MTNGEMKKQIKITIELLNNLRTKYLNVDKEINLIEKVLQLQYIFCNTKSRRIKKKQIARIKKNLLRVINYH